MLPILFAVVLQYVFGILMFLSALFLILLVLVQRGRGGGLSGAFGGMGGQSAFGTKAGDVFTRITVVTAAFWILLCMLSIVILNRSGPTKFKGTGSANIESTKDPEEDSTETDNDVKLPLDDSSTEDKETESDSNSGTDSK